MRSVNGERIHISLPPAPAGCIAAGGRKRAESGGKEVTKSASEVMHDVIVAAVIDGLGALRAASKGVPNALLRDLGAIHPNTTFQDLPAELQASIQTSVRAAFTRLQSEGYTVLNPKVAGVTPRPQPRPTYNARRRTAAAAASVRVDRQGGIEQYGKQFGAAQVWGSLTANHANCRE